MSNEILQLAFREKRNVRNELFLVDELDEVQLFEYQQKLKQSQENLTIENPYKVVLARMQKKIKARRIYYTQNAEKRREKARLDYQNYSPLLKEKKRLAAQKYRLRHPQRIKQLAKLWHKENKETANAQARERYAKWRKTLSDEELKAFHREKNSKSKEKRIAKFGIEKLREMERERMRKRYAAKKLNQQGDK